MTSFQNLIRFFHDCLREERSRAGIINLYATKILRRRLIQGTETVTEHQFTSLDLPPSIKEPFIKNTLLRGHGTELLYTTLPITGIYQGKEICCPLLLYPISIQGNDLNVELPELRLNPAVTSLFNLSASTIDELLELIPEGILGPVSPILLAKVLKKSVPELQISALNQFPKLRNSSSIRAEIQKNNLQILPASAIILAERTGNATGLLQELEQLSTMRESHFSPPLLKLLGKEFPKDKTRTAQAKPESIPTLLSSTQLDMIHAIYDSPLSVCQGPPGTGKTFSLAAAAAEQILRGQSVLITCRSNEAADVFYHKLTELIPRSQMIVRAGRKKHLRSLRQKVDRLLSKKTEATSHFVDSGLSEIAEQIHRIEIQIQSEIKNCLVTGKLFQSPPTAWWAKLRKWVQVKQLKFKPLLAEACTSFYELHNTRLKKARSYNQNLHTANLHRALQNPKTIEALKIYRKALKRNYAADQEKELQSLDPSALFQIFPVWITTTDDLHRVLPFKSALFDLAIIDEATQCDLSSTLPLLFRAKRALISGDPKQLRHLTFISNEKHEQLAKKHKLTPLDVERFHYRKVSLIDRAIDQTVGTPSFSFLDEHFRSLPDLIRFSNEHFYGNTLHLMRETETLTSRPQALTFTKVKGIRDQNGVNLQEIQQAIEICQSLETNTSIGFISPFRAQVDAFLNTLQNQVSPEKLNELITQHRLIAGTSYSFQGDERDHIILSLALDDNTSEGARRFAEREDVFNVAITRGRERMNVLHSFTPHKLPQNSLIKHYLQQTFPSPENTSFRKTSLKDLSSTLSALGWQPLPQKSLAGIPVDLLLKRDTKIIALDLIGTVGEEGNAISLSKALVLQRSGVALYPLRIEEWQHRKNEVIEFFNHVRS